MMRFHKKGGERYDMLVTTSWKPTWPHIVALEASYEPVNNGRSSRGAELALRHPLL